jgi:TP901 family phage tail tape measure protein
MADEPLEQEGGAGKTETVTLLIEAPIGNLAGPESGLNYAIRKLGAVNRMLEIIDGKYREFSSYKWSGPGGGGGFSSTQEQPLSHTPGPGGTMIVSAGDVTGKGPSNQYTTQMFEAEKKLFGLNRQEAVLREEEANLIKRLAVAAEGRREVIVQPGERGGAALDELRARKAAVKQEIEGAEKQRADLVAKSTAAISGESSRPFIQSQGELFGRPPSPAPFTTPGHLAELESGKRISLLVDPNQIHAHLSSADKIHLSIPNALIEATVTGGPVKATISSGGGSGGGDKGEAGGSTGAGGGAGGSRRILSDAKEPDHSMATRVVSKINDRGELEAQKREYTNPTTTPGGTEKITQIFTKKEDAGFTKDEQILKRSLSGQASFQIRTKEEELKQAASKTVKEGFESGASPVQKARALAQANTALSEGYTELAASKKSVLVKNGQELLHSELLTKAAQRQEMASKNLAMAKRFEERSETAQALSTARTTGKEELTRSAKVAPGNKAIAAEARSRYEKTLQSAYEARGAATTDPDVRAGYLEKAATHKLNAAKREAEANGILEQDLRREQEIRSRLEVFKGRRTANEQLGKELDTAGGDPVKKAQAQEKYQASLRQLYKDVAAKQPDETAKASVEERASSAGVGEVKQRQAGISAAEKQRRFKEVRDISIEKSVGEKNIAEAYRAEMAAAGGKKDAALFAEAKRAQSRATLNTSLASKTSDPRAKADFEKAAGEFGGKAAAYTAKATAEADKLADAYSFIGRNILQNIQHVTMWSAAVGVLYGAIGLAKSSMSSLMEISWQQARLSQVFRGEATEVRGLTDEVLALAAANGRSSNEAMEAAVQWSRLGLNRVEVTEAVRVSLMAANVAEISAAQATDHLSSLMSVYQLKASQLANVLAEMNSVTNTWNVTNNDLFQGLSRTAAIAKQAGIPLAELIGIIGAGVGQTGQTGSNIGNAVKSITGSITSKDTQQFLREHYDIEPTVKGGDEIKNMSQLLGELYVGYVKLAEGERQTLTFGVAGKQQASRMAAILDSYIKSQSLSINAQLNLNSAESENEKITGTLRSQVQGLATEWARFVNTQGSNGPVQAMTGITKAFHNLLKLANTGAGGLVTTAIGGILTATAARMVVAGIRTEGVARKPGEKDGIVLSSLMAVRRAYGDLGLIMDQIMTKFQTSAALGGPFKQAVGGMTASLYGFGAGLRQTSKEAFAASSGVGALGKSAALAKGLVANLVQALSIATVALWEWALPLAAVGLAIYGFNKAADVLSASGGGAGEAVERLTQQADQAKEAFNAAGQAIRLFETGMDAIKGARTVGQRVSIAEGMAEAAYPVEPDATPGERAAQFDKQQALKVQVGKMAKQNDIPGLNRIFKEEQTGEYMAFRGKQRIHELEAIEQAEGRINRRIKEIDSDFFSGGTTPRQKANAKEKEEGEKAKLNFRRVNVLMEANEDQETARTKWEASSQKHKTFLEEQNVIVRAIGASYDAIPHSGHISALLLEIEKLKTIEDYYKHNVELNKEWLEANEKAGRAMPEAPKEWHGAGGSWDKEEGTPSETKKGGGFLHQAVGVVRGVEGGLEDMVTGIGHVISDLPGTVKGLGQVGVSGIATGIAKPYKEAWEEGEYGEAIGRGIADVGTMVLGGGAVGKVAGKVGEAGGVGKAIAELGKAGEGAGALQITGKGVTKVVPTATGDLFLPVETGSKVGVGGEISSEAVSKWKFEAIKQNGAIIKGEITAGNQSEAIARIKQMGHFPTRVTPSTVPGKVPAVMPIVGGPAIPDQGKTYEGRQAETQLSSVEIVNKRAGIVKEKGALKALLSDKGLVGEDELGEGGAITNFAMDLVEMLGNPKRRVVDRHGELDIQELQRRREVTANVPTSIATMQPGFRKEDLTVYDEVIAKLKEIHKQETALATADAATKNGSEEGRQEHGSAKIAVEHGREETEAKRVALERSLAIEEQRSRQEVYTTFSESKFASAAVGDGMGEQMEARMKAEEQAVRVGAPKFIELQAQQERQIQGVNLEAAAKTGLEVEAQRVEMQTALKHLGDEILHGRELYNKTLTEEKNLTIEINRENDRKLLTAGPSEMLRRMAVSQMTGGGKRSMSSGEFFSMDTGGRQIVMDQPEHNPRMQEMERTRGAYKRMGYDRMDQQSTAKAYQDIQHRGGEYYKGAAGDAGADLINPAIKAAAESFDYAGKSAVLLGMAFENTMGALSAGLAVMGMGSGSRSQLPIQGDGQASVIRRLPQ